MNDGLRGGGVRGAADGAARGSGAADGGALHGGARVGGARVGGAPDTGVPGSDAACGVPDNGTMRGDAVHNGALYVDVTAERGDFTLDVAFSVAGGEVLAVLGENGSGKSTLLDVIAGFLRPVRGVVSVGRLELTRAGQGELGGPKGFSRSRSSSVGTVGSAGVAGSEGFAGVAGSAGSAGSAHSARSARPAVSMVGVERRGIGLLRQEALLFPHLTARQNIAFGPRSRGASRVLSRQIADEWLERIGLSAVGGRQPHRLSGGQRQRVAIARALAAAPRVLLLDEPFAALDVEQVPAIRRLLHDELRRTRTTAVLVTHEPVDAVQLADHCVVLGDGRVVDEADAAGLVAAPGHPFTAALVGQNLVRGRCDGRTLVTDDGTVLAGTCDAVHSGAPVAARAVFRPESVAVHPTVPSEPSWPATVSGLHGELRGVTVRTSAGVSALRDLDDVASSPLPAPGDHVWLSVPRERVRIVHD
ncbi:hypothetical protein GCM10027416_16980 [Okibacterium endophyticum]